MFVCRLNHFFRFYLFGTTTSQAVRASHCSLLTNLQPVFVGLPFQTVQIPFSTFRFTKWYHTKFLLSPVQLNSFTNCFRVSMQLLLSSLRFALTKISTSKTSDSARRLFLPDKQGSYYTRQLDEFLQPIYLGHKLVIKRKNFRSRKQASGDCSLFSSYKICVNRN